MSRAAVLQMVSGTDPETNLNQVRAGAEEAARVGAELLVLPENFALFDSTALSRFADSPDARRLLVDIAELAQTHSLWILAGSFPEMAPDRRVYARSILFDSTGKRVAQYDKRHLFDVDIEDAKGQYRESTVIAPGEGINVVETPVGRLGLSICYDLRFPAHYQRLIDEGAELISVPSAFTQVTGEAHWEVLLRARAIETQSYILGANQGGDHGGGRLTYGHSMIINPWGEVVAESSPAGLDLIYADIDLQNLHRIRREMPVQRHKRD